jgi:hypothetical protein
VEWRERPKSRGRGVEALFPIRPEAPLAAIWERMVHADDALECGTVAFSIFAQVSRMETVRLKTSPEGEASGSTQK